MGVDEAASLNYMQWHKALESERPYQLVSEDLPEIYGIPRQNFEIVSAPTENIQDIRGQEHHFNVEDHGFMYLQHDFAQVDFLDEAQVETVYKPEVEKLLKKHISGVDEVCFFQWRLRMNRRSPTTSKLGNIHVPTELLVPAHFVHLDQTLKTAIEYAEEYMGERTAQLLQGRLRIFNVWKPFDNPVYDCPLAVCDGSTVCQSDMIVCDNITKAKIAELILPLHNPAAKWHYLHRQRPDEVTIMKITDSHPKQGGAPLCPHCAFDQSPQYFDAETDPPRKSVEMRALVFTYPMEGLGVDHDGESAVAEAGEREAAMDERQSFVAQHLELTDAVTEERKTLVEQIIEPALEDHGMDSGLVAGPGVERKQPLSERRPDAVECA